MLDEDEGLEHPGTKDAKSATSRGQHVRGEYVRGQLVRPSPHSGEEEE